MQIEALIIKNRTWKYANSKARKPLIKGAERWEEEDAKQKWTSLLPLILVVYVL